MLVRLLEGRRNGRSTPNTVGGVVRATPAFASKANHKTGHILAALATLEGCALTPSGEELRVSSGVIDSIEVRVPSVPSTARTATSAYAGDACVFDGTGNFAPERTV